MFSISNIFDDEKSNSADNLSFIFSENIHLDENEDLNNNFKSSSSEKLENKTKTKSKKFIVSKALRKRNPDDIMKKIKSNAHKKLKLDINEKLKKLGCKYTFKSLPQHFIKDVTKKTNYEAMQLTYRELFEYTYNNLINDQNYINKEYNKKSFNAAIENYNKNQETLAYLDSNPEISKISGWEKIGNTKYIDLLKDFFDSKEFELIVLKLSKREDNNYINLYKYFTKTYFDFFLSYNNKDTNIHFKYINQNYIFGCDDNQNTRFGDLIKDDFPNLIRRTLMDEEIGLFGNYNPFLDEVLKDENSLIFDEQFMNQKNVN